MPEAQPLQPEDPRRLGAYELVGRLGSGGQGTVFLATGPGGERVAVKLLRVTFEDDGTARARFIRETAVARQVARFCTAQVLDADMAGDNPYLVSEYVPGPSLSRQVAQEGPITGGALERLAVNTASALAAIHRAGIVHRDLKPHNVLLGPDGPRVIDFGLSRVLDAAGATGGRPVGTPGYMAPEQVTGGDVGPPADVFAWGATMTFAATGRPPFGSDSITAVTHRVLHEEPDLGDLGGELRGLVAAALDKDPARRPTAAQVLLRLVGHDEAFATQTAAAPPDATSTDPPPPAQQGTAPTAPVEAETTAGNDGGSGAPVTPSGPSGPHRPRRPRGRGRRGRRRRGSRLPAALAALGIAAAAGGGTYGVMALAASGEGQGTSASGPSGVSPAASDAPTGTGRTSRAPSDPSRATPSRHVPRSPGTRPSRPGGGPAPTGGHGEDEDKPSDPPPEPVVLGAPDPQRYCAADGDRKASFRSGRWYCVRTGDGVGIDTPITMTQVCRSQYDPAAGSRLGGDAGVPADWDCYVLR
ncbi:hypothetical protein Acsp03_67900 [Actinomadura sp. NBRC 104412]|uniref:serine/threonine-protein kinase n=1 Tax=Actinomadura sp. NBRC 104412 TaxID=3032203 RepID=UPI0024A0DDE1|nr:serine/threonine-protein kinase [Actinomadura sp. NBRC 104412]GLZ09324.1 hypothetical protein Acsp03_67900 [Actinomadura sp. NBRC 104412]